MSVLLLPALCRKLGLGVASVYRRLDPKSKYFDPDFPRPKQIGLRRVAWVESEVDAYIERRPPTVPANERSERMKQIRKKEAA